MKTAFSKITVMIILALLIVIFLLLTITGISQNGTEIIGNTDQRSSISLINATLVNSGVLPKELPVFRVKSSEVSTEYVYRLATNVFGIRGGEVKEINGRYVIKGENGTLEVYKATGGIWFAQEDMLWNPELNSTLPPEDKAKEIADRFINESGLKPAEGLISVEHQGTTGTKVAILKTNPTASMAGENGDNNYRRSLNSLGSKKIRELDRQVNYRFKIRGMNFTIPVTGGGGKIDVTIGDKSKIICYNGPRVEIEGIEGNYSLISPAEAIEKLMGSTRIEGEAKYNVSLAYYLAPNFNEQRYLLPVYFISRTINAKGREFPMRDSYVPATHFAPASWPSISDFQQEAEQPPRYNLTFESPEDPDDIMNEFEPLSFQHGNFPEVDGEYIRGGIGPDVSDDRGTTDASGDGETPSTPSASNNEEIFYRPMPNKPYHFTSAIGPIIPSVELVLPLLCGLIDANTLSIISHLISDPLLANAISQISLSSYAFISTAQADEWNAYEVGASWIGKSMGLENSQENARGFIDELTADGFMINFNWGDKNAWEKDWDANDDNWADSADIVFYTGHADKDGWILSIPEKDCIGTQEISGSSSLWGNKDLEWIIIAACGPLEDDIISPGGGDVFRWTDAFKGLHQILGYGSASIDNVDEGRIAAKYMKEGKTMIHSWFRTAKEIQPLETNHEPPYGPDIWAGVMYASRSGIESPSNDHLWSHGSVSHDPIYPDKFTVLWTKV